MRKEKDKKIEIREIVYSQDDEKSFGDIFVYEPENIEEQNLGSLFIVGELKDLPRNSSYVVNLLASKIKKEFYSNTKRSAEESLESALAGANQTLSEIAQQGNGEYVGKLSMICGTYRSNKFYLSQVGRIRSLLVRDGQILDIIKEEDNKPASTKRAFNNIASGELVDGDIVIFATSGLFNIFSLEKLRQLASSKPLDEFATQLQNEIEEEDSEVVSALVLELSGGKRPETINHTAVALESVDMAGQDAEAEAGNEDDAAQAQELAEAENDEDEKVLIMEDIDAAELEEKEGAPEEKPEIVAPTPATVPSPIVSPIIEKIPVPVVPIAAKAHVEKSVSESEEIPVEIPIVDETLVEDMTAEPVAVNGIMGKDPEKISLSDIIREYEKIDNRPSESSLEKDKNIESIIGKKTDSDFQDLDDNGGRGLKGVRQNLKDVIASIDLAKAKSSLSGRMKKVAAAKPEKEYKVKSMSKPSGLLNKRNAVVAVVVVIAIAAVAYPILMKNKAAKDKASQYQAILADAQSKLDQAQNDPTGKNAAAAKDLAQQVKNEYGQLGSQADEIAAKAQSELDAVDKVVKVTDLQTVATFDNANIKTLAEVNSTYYAIDGKENVVYKADAKSGKLVETARSTNKIGEIKYAQNLQNLELLFSDGSSFSSYGLKGTSVQTLSGKLTGAMQDMVSYGKNVYVLSPADNQINKYQKAADGLSNKTAWLKSGDVKNAVSIAIDQNIFVLYSDGTVKKFYGGTEYSEGGKTFSLQQPSEAPAGATKIFTLPDMKNLYILDASKGRVLIFDKTNGALVKQLKGDGFNDIKDISVDAKETTLTLLMSGKLSKVKL
jgi:serine/threonine protein phosphatase PrpC/Tfp pilus assembly protein PilN